MKFNLKNEWGDHKTYSYDTDAYKFLEYFEQLYQKDLNNIHLTSEDYLSNSQRGWKDTDLMQKFYNNLRKDNIFVNKYQRLIRDILSHFFPNDKCLIYQTLPAIRFQTPNGVVVVRHKDSESVVPHPLGEKNVLIPITEMKNTASLFVESEPDKKDFKSIELCYGELFYFNGNTCTHYNEKNKENRTRISFDFRIMRVSDYCKHLNNNEIKINNHDIECKRKIQRMMIGSYYQILFQKEPFIVNKIDKTIVQMRPTFSTEEADACYNYMKDDTYVTEYKKTLELENMLCKYLNCKNCIMTTSGTSALLLSLMSLNLNIGDEVIVPNYTMIATINVVKMLKLTPVIIDVNKDTFTIDYNEIKNNTTNKTKCVIHVSLNNRYKNLDQIVQLCEDNGIILIEDAAQSLGCKINGKSLGTFGKLGCFSLSTPKIISTGQGGFIVTNDEKLSTKIRMIKDFGRKKSGTHDYEIFGINLKFTDIQAVIGIEQVKKLDYRVTRIRQIYNLYYENLKGFYNIKAPLSEEWIPWFVDIYTDYRDEIKIFLKKHLIETRATYGEINKTKIYYSDKNFINSEYVSKKCLFLPSFITIRNDEILHVCQILKLFYHQNLIVSEK